MIPMVEEYEWCWNFGTYFGAECELCPHREECRKERDNEVPVLQQNTEDN